MDMQTHVVTSEEQINKIFSAQEANQYNIAKSTVKERRAKLKKLLVAFEKTYRDDIKEALHKDYAKQGTEVDLTEIYAVTSAIKHTSRHLAKWMKNERVKTPLSLLGGSSYVRHEPKGVCLLISPWNFPFNLTFKPLVSAIAAGNTVIIKPSELTPHSSALMKKMVADLFPENEVAVVEGGIPESTHLLELPFNHIFFTGAPSIGKVVMKAAAEHLTSVTLELGGKSPVIVDETANVKIAAQRITWGKFINCGQICIAPDYIYVHKSQIDEFVREAKKNVDKFYGSDPIASSDYPNIVNDRHCSRVKSYIDDSVSKGATVVHGGKIIQGTNSIEPTIVTNVPMDSGLMQNEIFGPVMPVLVYEDINEVINSINSGEKPLGLYVYSRSSKNSTHIINSTRAGGSCINNNAVHYFNNYLPFGGVNNSGIGKSSGIYSFKEFCNERAVYKQVLPSALDMLAPPYNGFKQTLIDLTIKFF